MGGGLLGQFQLTTMMSYVFTQRDNEWWHEYDSNVSQGKLWDGFLYDMHLWKQWKAIKRQYSELVLTEEIKQNIMLNP